jgi:primosomal protein N' (replication factor Y) (superfamily II helicase)
MFVNVALNIPADKLFTYAVPENMQQAAGVGKRVFVPFGHRKRTGFIIAVSSTCNLQEVKPIQEILDDEPLFGSTDLDFYSWISDYFMYPLGKTLAELIPTGSEKKDFLWITPIEVDDDLLLSPAQKNLLSLIQQYPRGITLSNLVHLSDLKNTSSVVHNLHLAGRVRIQTRQSKQMSARTEKFAHLVQNTIAEVKLTARQNDLVRFMLEHKAMPLGDLIKKSGSSKAVVKNLQEKGLITFSVEEKIRTSSLASSLERKEAEFLINPEQNHALAEIRRHLATKSFAPVLLHGVTGSGKTEVYLNAIEEVLKNGGAAIYLVPEIALTPQLISRIAGRFDEQKIAVLHSGIAEGVRFDQWRQIKRGKINLVIGARSALFAPLPNLKLIIVDEEHDASYKQDDRLCYHARDLAVLRAQQSGIVVILGSATPGIRSYFNAKAKKYFYLELSERVENKPLPQVEIVDMKAQKEMQGKIPILSAELIAGMEETLGRNEQVLLFLNKRGFDTFLVCADCGYNFRCPHCDVSLKSHLSEKLVKCHYCDYTMKAMPLCPSCKGSRILSYGTGTQKLEKEIERLFPAARIRRMDSDTTSQKGAQEEILRELMEREIDVLAGTQMITKGHDFPFITLVGVIAADTSLNMPDFRAAEKTFQMLTQVAGRSGRGKTPGRVIIQTFNPQHYALKHARNHDYKSFYTEEIDNRKALQYPPFGRIINIRLSSTSKESLDDAATAAGKLARTLSAGRGRTAEIIGPAESPLARIQGRYRKQMLIKDRNIKVMHAIAREILETCANSQVKITVDVDPENFM